MENYKPKQTHKQPQNKSDYHFAFFAVIACLGLNVSIAQAQHSVNAGGGEASGTGGTVSFTLGQIDYSYFVDNSASVSQGVQQPFEIYTTSIPENTKVTLSVFPNPTTNELTLQLKDNMYERLFYRLFDLSGKLVVEGIITNQQTQISMKNMPVSTYFLSISTAENKRIQSFKIIKN